MICLAVIRDGGSVVDTLSFQPKYSAGDRAAACPGGVDAYVGLLLGVIGMSPVIISPGVLGGGAWYTFASVNLASLPCISL